jgi:hypothetical protein
MKQSIQGAAKRLILSLIAVSALGGCAVYGPPAPGPYAYATDANGQPIYAAPPVYANPGYPYYYHDPWYIGPPLFFNFGIRWHRGGHRDFRRGHR